MVRGTLDARRLSQTHTVQPTIFKSTLWVCGTDPPKRSGKVHRSAVNSFRALSRRLEFTVRRPKLNKILSSADYSQGDTLGVRYRTVKKVRKGARARKICEFK